MLRYVHPQSLNCVNVLLAAEMLKLPLQRAIVDLMQCAQCRRPIRSYVVSDRPVRRWLDGIRLPPAWSAAQPGGALL